MLVDRLGQKNFYFYIENHYRICYPIHTLLEVMILGKDGFERMLCFHCAPTFAGIKPASLVSFQKSRFEDFDALLESYATCFECKGITPVRLTEGEEYVLMLFYRRKLLERILEQPAVLALLARFGYRAGDAIEAHLEYLSMRIQLQKSFPHEVGLFLGYPAEDVEGFIENKGRDFACAGYWKVYANEEETRALFQRYTDCTERLCARLGRGTPMAELLEAV